MKKVIKYFVLSVLVLLLIPMVAVIFLYQILYFVFEVAKDMANDMTLKFIEKVETLID